MVNNAGIFPIADTADIDEATFDAAIATKVKRYAMPAEITEAAIYLASNDANFVHGITLPVDGGYLAM